MAIMSQVLVVIKCLFYLTLCGGSPRVYYFWKALGFKILGGLSLYERKDVLFLEKSLPESVVAIDIGAHLGVYSRLFASKAGQSGKVFLFEPFPYCFDYLQRAFKGAKNIKVYPFAISNQNGSKFYLHIPKLCGLVPEAALASVSNERSEGSVEIETRSLDSFIGEFERLDIIKADIEGHELKFFAGAQGIIKKFRPLILFEDNAISKNIDSYRQLERELNYSLKILSDSLELTPYGAGEHTGYNFYFVPNS